MKSVSGFLVVLLILVFGGSALGAPPDIDLAREAGEIRGTLSYCGQEDSEGIVVYIPGTSFMARTAMSTSPKAVIKMTTAFGSISCILSSQ